MATGSPLAFAAFNTDPERLTNKQRIHENEVEQRRMRVIVLSYRKFHLR